MVLTKLTKPRARWSTFKLNALGTTLRTLYDKLTEGGIHVKDFGAKSDGITDDTLALELAMKEAYTKKVNVLIAEDMLINGTIDISYMDFTQPIKLVGGKITRTVDGAIFTATDNNRDAPILSGIRFEGAMGVVPSVFDVTGSRRHQSYGCYYNRFCFFSGEGFSQSLRFSKGNIVYRQPAPFLRATSFYDPKVFGNQFETSDNLLVEALGSTTASGEYAITGGSFVHNLVEGYTNSILFELPNCKNFTCSYNYTEGNLGIIRQRNLPTDPNKTYRMEGFHFVNNYIGSIKGNVVLDIPNGKLGSSDIDLNDIKFATNDPVNNVFIRDNLYQSAPERNTINGGRLTPSSARVFQNVQSDDSDTSLAIRYSTESLGSTGVRVVIKNLISRLSTSDANKALCSNAFIVTLSGQYSAGSSNYRMNYVGILTFASAYSDEVKIEVALTPLVRMHTNGDTRPNQSGSDADVVVKFPNSTTLKPFTEAHAENQVYLELPNVMTVENICITPINNVLVQSGYHVLPFYAQ